MTNNKKIFISGSMNKKELHKKVLVAVDKIILNNNQIIIGDACGIDQKIQKYLAEINYDNVLVCSITKPPRVLESIKFDSMKVDCKNTIKSNRDKQIKKDEYMTAISDISFVIWNGKSRGSYNNILRSIKNNKEVQIFLDNEFLIGDYLKDINIKKIYNERHKYSLSEYLKEHKNDYIKSTKQMKLALIQNNILTKNGECNKKYNEDMEIENIRGNDIIKYKKSLLDKYFQNKQGNLFTHLT